MESPAPPASIVILSSANPGFTIHIFFEPYCSNIAKYSPLLQLFDSDVAVPDPFGFILKADVALGRSVLQPRFAEVEIDDLLAIEDDFQDLVDQSDGISIPLTGGLHHVF